MPKKKLKADIPFKKNKPKLVKPEPAVPPVTLPTELAQKWTAVEACATTYNILDKGMFPHQFMEAVRASLAFVKKLHEQSVKAAMADPDADLIPELKELKKAKAAEEAAKAKAEKADADVKASE